MSLAFVGKPAPDFSATAVVKRKFKTIKLTDYKGKFLILFFYPLDFTFVCPTEIIAFNDRYDQFKAIDCELVACSVDSEYSHLAWTKQSRENGGLGPINIPLLSDITKSLSRNYGVLTEDGVALRGLFIIDKKSILRQITINDMSIGRSVEETLRLVKAIQYTDKYGEVCPADWSPGEKTIVPDPVSSQKYFEGEKK